nr:GYDIA family GHMP kinase [Ulvibacterium sp.]
MVKQFYSNGKLLLTGEYAVLDGALSLALPTRYGQSLDVKEIESPKLLWKSLDHKGATWFEMGMDIPSWSIHYELSSQKTVKNTLIKILTVAKTLNPKFLEGAAGYQVETKLNFPKDWGLGSSSTLINNIAQWAQIDPYQLLWKAFSGSGYDIACAQFDHPILYHLKNQNSHVEKADFNPTFKDYLFFVYRNRKQDSREGIAQYRKTVIETSHFVHRVTGITQGISTSKSLAEFNALITEHENLLATTLKLVPVQKSLFPDFGGAIKSLGAWGGDFILASGKEDIESYFKQKGYDTIIPYSEMVL